MGRKLAPWLFGAALLIFGLAAAPADPAPPHRSFDTPPSFVPEGDPAHEPEMDHGEKHHHHHQHLADHRGYEHKPAGLGEHHHHHHTHPHGPDPHHHHPH